MGFQQRLALPPYTAGTISGNAGQPVVTGVNTGWLATDSSGNLVPTVVGGDLLITSTVAIPIKSVDSATQITLEFSLPSALGAGTAYRIIKYSANQTGAVSNLISQLLLLGTDAAPDMSRTVDSGAARVKLRVGANGDPQLAVGPTNAADAALLPALDINPSTGAVTFPNGFVQFALMGRNGLANGNFAINQRGYASGTNLAAGAYGHDRLKAGANGGAYTFTQAVPDTTINITGGTMVMTVGAANLYAAAGWLTWFGTAGARVWQGSASGAFTQGQQLTIGGVTVNAIYVTNLAFGNNTILEFSPGTVTRVQFEAAVPNAGPTIFERRHLALESLLCCRFYQLITTAMRFTPTSSSPQGYDTTISYAVMAGTPTAVRLSAGYAQNNLSPSSPPAFTPLGNNSARYEITSAGSGDTYSIGDLWALTVTE